VAAQSSISFLALFTSPHGTSEDISYYESILVIASGFRIAAAVPYLKKMIYGYNTCTSQVRRLYLVWQVESIGEVAATQSLLNNLLKDDIMDEGYVRIGSSRWRLPSGTDITNDLRFSISLYIWGMASSRTNYPLVNINESVSTGLYQIMIASSLSRHRATKSRGCLTSGRSTVRR
jgi:hypothetical protein